MKLSVFKLKGLTSLLVIGACMAIPIQAQAQTGCSGAIGIATTPDTFAPGQALLYQTLPETVNVTLTPAVAVGSNSMDVDQVNYDLSCADNTPTCANGDEVGDLGGKTITFIGLNGANTCGAVATPDAGGDFVTFDLPNQLIGEAGCTIDFDVSIIDKGTDADPLILTSATQYEGICTTSGGVELGGGATGSVPFLLVEPVCVPEVDVCVAVDTDDDGSFVDESCIPDAIGLNATNESGAKDFRYFVDGGKSAESDDLSECVLEEFDGADWVPVVTAGWDGVLDGPLSEIYTEDGVCSANGSARQYRISCGLCMDIDLPIDPAGPVDASVECADCAVDVQKEVSCDDGSTWGESCTGWDGDSETSYRYTVSNPDTTRAVDIDSCVLSDPLAAVNPGNPTGPIFPGSSAAPVVVQNTICEDGEGNTSGDVICTCLPTAGGADLQYGDNVVGENLPGSGNTTFGACETSDDDPAQLLCESAGLNITKTCDEQDEADNSLISIVVTNIGEADLTNCTVTDTLEGGANVPLTCLDDVGGAAPMPFTIPGSAFPGERSFTCSATVAGLTEDTDNVVSVTCNVEDTTKTKTATDNDLCEVPGEGCITRTPGFWGTHPHVTSVFLPLNVCGVLIDEVVAEAEYSATEDMCSVGKDAKTYGTSNQQTQLIRQCMAAALNIEASLQGEGSCGSEIGDTFASCCFDEGALCNDGATADEINASECIGMLDEFNNSLDTLDNFGPFISPGPANSQYCRDSKNNGWLNPDRNYGPR